ncbi:cupin domain-containing protein [Nesterenkonia sandarakina]|uniref:Mannose-6-phosphate isomerase-like protein (Cupin superfamily) n=1 Tax=Nesterenkonia sandarakina TaxID=272918 RepID=A0A7Z0E759_9MICC|nr:cupin domain-containing protein [Nesterenkonia sandarakina]NYJ15647.1 mannose-6-phosphate isomerase-like protein (cupin superfamily) [Nesterenkonia sandarakina]
MGSQNPGTGGPVQDQSSIPDPARAAHRSLPRSLPRFPGGTSLSHLCVYDWETSDGLHGGSPHLHTLSTEAYVVTSGRGEVHTISAAGPAVDELTAGSLLWFTPGTVHRLVNQDQLQMQVIMSNAGLPEAGDAVLTFPEEIVADPQRYREAVTLPAAGDEGARADAARARRDLAIDGYEQLLGRIQADGAEAMRRFHELAVALVRPRVGDWRQIWEDNVETETRRTKAQLQALGTGDGSHLREAAVIRGTPRPEPRLWGMCGRLQTWTGPEPESQG